MSASRPSFAIDQKLQRIAATQLGLVSLTQALDSGTDQHALHRRREAGLLAAVFPGVSRHSVVTASAQQRALAAALCVPEAVITGPSAALIHGFPLPPRFADIDVDTILSVTKSRVVRIRGIKAVRQSVQPPSRPWHSVRLATPAATLIMLAKFADPAIVERCLDHCIVHRLATVREVRQLILGVPARSVKGRRMLLELLQAREDDNSHRSGLEQRVARWMRSSGIDSWRQNFVVPDVGIEVDFAWPDHRLALEISPFFTHGSRRTQARDAERRRRLVACGWRVIEATDRDLENPRAFMKTVALLRRLLIHNP